MHDPTRGHAVSIQEGHMSKLCGGSMLFHRDHRGAGVTLAPLAAAVLVLALALGTGSTYAAPRAAETVLLAAATDVSNISAGDYHSCFVLSDGGIKCSGGNAYGELGDGTTTIRWTPVDVSGIDR